MNLLRQHWQNLQSSMWFIPTLIVVGAVVLAVAMIEVESLGSRWPRLFGAGAEGSRGLLSTIAGSMITVAGVTFSITIVSFTLASSQYTSRILRNFMRARANQTVLGVFLGVFAYCLVVLRTIRSGDEGVFVPGLAVFVAVLLAFMGIGFLMFFIHHIARSLQATSRRERSRPRHGRPSWPGRPGTFRRLTPMPCSTWRGNRAWSCGWKKESASSSSTPARSRRCPASHRTTR